MTLFCPQNSTDVFLWWIIDMIHRIMSIASQLSCEAMYKIGLLHLHGIPRWWFNPTRYTLKFRGGFEGILDGFWEFYCCAAAVSNSADKAFLKNISRHVKRVLTIRAVMSKITVKSGSNWQTEWARNFAMWNWRSLQVLGIKYQLVPSNFSMLVLGISISNFHMRSEQAPKKIH